MSNAHKTLPTLLWLAAVLAAGGLACKKPTQVAKAEPVGMVTPIAVKPEAQAVRQTLPGPDVQAGDAAEAARKAAAANQAANQAAYRKAAQGVLKDVHFTLDKSEVRPSDKPILVAVAAFMKAYPQGRLLIDGNSDERGTVEYNLALGERRSQATLAYLVGLGVAEARLTTTTYGKEKPMCSEHQESCWAMNRRAHFTVPE